MNYKQNLHVHTTYCDGKDTPEEIILSAMEKGFDSIGFSEHSYMHFSSYPNQMTVEKSELYKQEIRRLKEKYEGDIDIFCGLEFEYFSEVPAVGYDYIIGSLHYLDFDGKVLGFDSGYDETMRYIRDNFCMNGLDFAKKYYETLCMIPEKLKVDILGHFDLLVKNNEKGRFIDETSKEYLDLGFEAIHTLKGKIPLFEVNTGAIARGYRILPYPRMEFLKEFRKCGYGVVITSDCHNRDHLDCIYDDARELILAAGFKTKWIMTDCGFSEVEL